MIAQSTHKQILICTALKEEVQKKEVVGETVPQHIQEPTLEALRKLRQKPVEGEPEAERDARNQAFIFFVEHLLPTVRGSKEWRHLASTRCVSDTDATASDEAFALLCAENMWDKWHSTITNDSSAAVRRAQKGKYTANGTNQKFSGWSAEGLNRYNELFTMAVRNCNETWASDVEGAARDYLQKLHFTCASIDEIRKVKRRRKSITSEEEESSPVLPRVMWDETMVEEV